jgi:hypothetical protein
MGNLDWGCYVHHLRLCRLLPRGFDRWDAAVYGWRDVRHAHGGKQYCVAEVAGTNTARHVAGGKMDG